MKYKLIYVDPPWGYRDEVLYKKYRPTPRGAKQHYSLMTMDEIKNIPINKLSQDDAVCFLWVTVPFLSEGFDVLNAWGFKYKTSLFWYKINTLGLGSWFRNNMEICLIGIKGKVKAFHQQISNVIIEQPKKHSSKPKRFYFILENLNLEPKIELFGRDRREGWDSWGDQLPDSTQQIWSD